MDGNQQRNERKKKYRLAEHYKKQISILEKAEKVFPAEGNRVQICIGTPPEVMLREAVQRSPICNLNKIGPRNAKGDRVFGAIITFVDDNSWGLIENKRIMINSDCLAAQGGHETAEHYQAKQLTGVIGGKILLKWPVRGSSNIKQWLPQEQVRSPSKRKERSRRSYIVSFTPNLSHKGEQNIAKQKQKNQRERKLFSSQQNIHGDKNKYIVVEPPRTSKCQ